MPHTHGKRSALTLVTESGITFTPCDCGVLVGGIAPLGKRIVSRILAGTLRVTTPHRAGGAYRERGPGGVYATINAKARLRSLAVQCENDPRIDAKNGKALFSTIQSAYGQN